MELQCFQITMHKGWALLEMARPDKLNVIDETVLTELEAILQHFKEEQVKAVVVTGQGRACAAGADVGAMAEMDSQEAKQFSVLGNKVFQAIEDHPAVFVAAVNGYALGGGCELALACDLRLASEKATCPAGNQAGHHPRLRRHAASPAHCRGSQGEGMDLHGQAVFGPGSFAGRCGFPSAGPGRAAASCRCLGRGTGREVRPYPYAGQTGDCCFRHRSKPQPWGTGS